MRTLYLLGVIYLSVNLTSCTETQTNYQPMNTPIPSRPLAPATHHHHKKNPLTVTFLKGKPKMPYKVVGLESISKFNLGGNKRQEASIRDGMRELAAAMGGDAVIDIKHDAKSISGTVIAYQGDKDKKISAG